MAQRHLCRNSTTDRGGSILEYSAVIALVAVLATSIVLIAPGVGARIAAAIGHAVCAAFGGEDCAAPDQLAGGEGENAAPDADPKPPNSAEDATSDEVFAAALPEREVDPQEVEQDTLDILAETESGREALDYIEDNPDLTIEFVSGIGDHIGGSYSSDNERIRIDIASTAAARTGNLIHELDHHRADRAGELADPTDYDPTDPDSPYYGRPDAARQDFLQAMADFETRAVVAQMQFHQELDEAWDDVDLSTSYALYAYERENAYDAVYDDAYDRMLPAPNRDGPLELADAADEEAEHAVEQATFEAMSARYFGEDPGTPAAQSTGSARLETYLYNWARRWHDEHGGCATPPFGEHDWCPPPS